MSVRRVLRTAGITRTQMCDRTARARSRRIRHTVVEALEDRTLLSSSIPLNPLSWTPIGPAGIVATGGAVTSGRVTGVAADPSDANVIYITAADGGVWKTTNGGAHWTPLTDDQPTLAMSAIAVAPSNPQILYGTTGEADHTGNSLPSNGILKSTDGGKTWAQLGSSWFSDYPTDSIAIGPFNPDIVVVAGSSTDGQGRSGLSVTTQGGTSWSNTLPIMGIGPTSFRDVIAGPGSFDKFFAANGVAGGADKNGVYVSTTTGGTWSPAGNFPMGATNGRISLGISQSTYTVMYAALSDPVTQSLNAVYTSRDGGKIWTATTRPPDYLGGFGDYANALAVDPTDANIVYLAGSGQGGSTEIVESRDGGASWSDISSGGGIKPHAFVHRMTFDAAGRLLLATDGGVWRLDNPFPDTIFWSDINGDLQITTLNGVALNPANSNIVYGGGPSIGTEKFTDNLAWTQIRGGDGGLVRVDPSSPQTIYHTYTGNSIERSDDGGQTWADVSNGLSGATPIYPFFTLDPNNSSHVLFGTDRVYLSTNKGAKWTAVSAPNTSGWNDASAVTAIAAAPTDSNTIYAATSSGHVFATTNGGATWSARDVPNVIPSSLAVDPANSHVVYATSVDSRGVVRSTDGGVTWQNISFAFGAQHVWCIAADRQNGVTKLYVGADNGVYVTSDTGTVFWSRYGTGMPNVVVTGLEINHNLDLLAAATLGRGTWEISLPPVVTNTNDSGPGSLRQAILDANAHAGRDAIDFEIGSGAKTITLLSPLPAITDPVVINAATQPGFTGAPIVEINGAGAGAGANGLTISGPNITIQGLVINRFSGDGILLNGGSDTGDQILGNYIGTDLSGTAAMGNGRYGVELIGGASNNTIGGSTPGTANVLSANGLDGIGVTGNGTSGNQIVGNRIGTDAAGRARLGNAGRGISISGGATGNTIGSIDDSPPNVISANGSDGVAISGAGTTGNRILWSYIGTDLTGEFGLGNAANGVSVFGGASGDSVIGDIISGNGLYGVKISGVGANNNYVGYAFIGAGRFGGVAIPNLRGGVLVESGAQSNSIGGVYSGISNFISGNSTPGAFGVRVTGVGTDNNIVAGNEIGIAGNQASPLGNGGDGVLIDGGAQSNRVGTDGSVANSWTPNWIGSNAQNGVAIQGSGTNFNVVTGNYIGYESNKHAILPNAGDGVLVSQGAQSNRIGAEAGDVDVFNDPNVIGANVGAGIRLSDAGTSQNRVGRNFIGTDANANRVLANSDGIVITAGADGNVVAGMSATFPNLIKFNRLAGISITGQNTTGNTIRFNSIYDNGGLGIDLGDDGVTPDHGTTAGNGPNNLPNYPLITSVSPGTTAPTTTLKFSFEGLPNATYTFDFYISAQPNGSGFGDGQDYLGSASVTTDADGRLNPSTSYTFSSPSFTTGQWISATATDQNGNTSEFSFAQPALTQPHGVWTPVSAPAPAGAGVMLLLSDGTVIVQAGEISKAWYRYAPDSHGDYVAGSWSQLASMSTPRLDFASNVLPDGRVLVLGGEFTDPSHPGTRTETNTGEIYDPVADAWTSIATFPQPTFGDDPSQLLPDGRVLAGSNAGAQTYIYDPAADAWSPAATKLRPDASAGESWLKLPDDSFLVYESNSATGGASHAERYVPSTNSWVDAGTVPVLLSSAATNFEIGPSFLVPDDRAFYLGATGHTAFYSLWNNSWTSGPDIPNGLVADDAPGAMMPNGKILFAADKPLNKGPVALFEFDPFTNTYTNVTPLGFNLGSASSAGAADRMLILPSGQVLFSNGSNVLGLYAPAGSPNPAAQPSIYQITSTGDGTFTLAGTQLNGISQGASHGDDSEMDANYPIVRLTDSSGGVFYARTTNWSSTGVATGPAVVSTRFTLPAGMPAGTYWLSVIASGIASNPLTFVFGGATTTTVTAAPTSPSYGQQVTFTATVAAGSSAPAGSVQFVIDGADYGGPVPLSGGAASVTDSALSVGAHSVTVGYVSASGANFLPSSGALSGGISVGKAHLTVAADPKSKIYGDPAPALTATITGFVKGDTASVVSGSASLSTPTTASSGVGVYLISVNAGTLTATNYDFPNLLNGAMTVTPAHLTVTADAKTAQYGATATLTATLSGFVLGETAASAGVTGSANPTTTATSASPVGSYTITSSAGSLAAPNYDFPHLVNGSLTINKAHLTVSADPKMKLYGATVPVLTATLSGFVNGQTSSVVSGAPVLSSSVMTSSAAGTFAIGVVAGSLSATNYDFPTFVAATFTVQKAHLTVTADPKTKLYGSPLPALTTALSGFVLGETAATANVTGSAAPSTSATAASAVGNYPISVSGGSLAASNYDFANLVSGVLAVGKAHLTVTADANAKLYGAPTPALSTTLSGFVNGDTAAVVTGAAGLSTATTPASVVGAYPITVGVGTLSAANYDFPTLVNGTLTIKKAHLTVTTDPKAKLYGAAMPALSATLSGFVNSETAAVVAGAPSLTTTAAAGSGAGTYPITVGLGALSAANYDFPNFVNGVLTVNKAHLTVTADTKARAHGITNPPLTYVISGFVNADAPSVVTGAPAITTSATTASPPGSYPIKVGQGALAAANYDFPSLVAGTLVVSSPGDFNGDGKTDTAIYDQSISEFFILMSNGGATRPFFGNPAHLNIPIAGDFDGDGKTDVAVYDQAASAFNILLSAGGAIVRSFGNPSHVNIPVAGDFDRDGKTDLTIYDQTSSQWFILLSGGGAQTPTFGDPSHVNVPVAGDFDRDGKSDIAIYDQTASRFYVLLSGGGATTPSFGNPAHTNVPIAGDFDGDGKSDLAIYDQTTSQFFVLLSGGGAKTPTFGNPAHVNVPVAGDYDGDGKTDIGIYDQSASQFFILFSGGGANTPLFGNPADINVPIPSVYLRGRLARSYALSISGGGSPSFDLGASAQALASGAAVVSRSADSASSPATILSSTRRGVAKRHDLETRRPHGVVQRVIAAVRSARAIPRDMVRWRT
jgi:MBG domain (YGX type)/Bacterial Ig-like domain (group 3)